MPGHPSRPIAENPTMPKLYRVLAGIGGAICRPGQELDPGTFLSADPGE